MGLIIMVSPRQCTLMSLVNCDKEASRHICAPPRAVRFGYTVGDL